MGTNYYLRRQCCPTCGRGEDLHIGKSSAGWCFSLHVEPCDDINGLEEWKKLLEEPNSVIKDEYGETIPVEEMMRIITERKWKDDTVWDKPPYGYDSWSQFHRDNHSERGPNGMLRHRLGLNCIKQGEGTWDCITGDFS